MGDTGKNLPGSVLLILKQLFGGYVPERFGRYAGHNLPGRYVAGYYCSCGCDAVGLNRKAGEKYGVGTDASTVLDGDAFKVFLTFLSTAQKIIVCSGHLRGDKAVVTNCGVGTYEDTGLYFAPSANIDSVLDDCASTNYGVFPNRTFLSNRGIVGDETVHTDY